MHDKCDRCPARAAYHCEHGTDVLRFCGHHQQEFGAALRAKGWLTFRIAEMKQPA